MRKKINKYMIAVAITAVLSTALLLSFLVNGIIQKQAMGDLQKECSIIMDIAEKGRLSEYDFGDIRVTHIAENGEVIFDSNADINTMEDHSDRPEFIDAFKYGEGSSIRKSDTIDEDTYYFARKTNNGSVIRVSCDAKNIMNLFSIVLPYVIGIIIIMITLSVFITKVLTKKILEPIEKIPEDISYMIVPEYDELIPVVNMLKEQHENVLNSAKVRQEFSANVSHELKTPLTVISGYAELIENKMVDESTTIRFAGEIHHHSNRLLTLINDIIKLSEMDSDGMEVVYEDINLTDIVNDSMRILKGNAYQHDINISFDCDESTMVRGCASMLDELVSNLVNNAIIYNKPGGSVWVSVKNTDSGVALKVKDTGIGIPEKYKERVFERFYRVDKSRSKSSGGTGLGLAIVKHIAQRHNADIKLESKEGHGTEITVTF